MIDSLDRGQTKIRANHGCGSCTYRIRLLSTTDLSELVEFHRFIHSGLSHPHILRRDEASYLRQNLGETGITLGAYGDSKGLIGYAALAFPKTTIAKELCRDLPTLNLLPHDVAVYDGSAVHPAYRGRGLHDQLNRLRHEHAVHIGARHLLGTVSLQNPYSLRNHLTRGFVVRAICEKYEGMLRLIIHNDLNSVLTLSEFGQHRCELPDPTQHRKALDSGFVGYRVERLDTRWFVSYARPAGLEVGRVE